MKKLINTAFLTWKMNFSFTKLFIYMIRWQLSSPILGIVMWFFGGSILDSMNGAVIANLIGSLIFYWFDMLTFSASALKEQWSVKNGNCCDCGQYGRLYRLVITPNYNKLKSEQEYRCESCSIEKTNVLLNNGVQLAN
jgi:hypothetical protein